MLYSLLCHFFFLLIVLSNLFIFPFDLFCLILWPFSFGPFSTLFHPSPSLPSLFFLLCFLSPPLGRGDLQPQLDSAMQDVNDMYLLMEETEKQAVRRALVEERGRFCTFIGFLQPVVVLPILTPLTSTVYLLHLLTLSLPLTEFSVIYETMLPQPLISCSGKSPNQNTDKKGAETINKCIA